MSYRIGITGAVSIFGGYFLRVACLLCIVLLSAASAEAYTYKYIKNPAEKQIFESGLRRYQEYRLGLSAGDYTATLTALKRLRANVPELTQAVNYKMTALLIRYYSADDIIRFSLREDIQFKELLYKRYFNDFLGDLRAGKINRTTAKNFVGLFSFVNDPNLDHVLIYTYEKNSPEYSALLKKLWLTGGLYIPSGSTHYTQKDADEIRRRAGQKDWEAHYAGKYNLREYKYIRTTIKDAIRTVQTSSYYPEKLYYIYFKTLFRTRNYREFLNELFSARFGLLFGNYEDLVYDALAAYLRLEEFEKADMLIQTLEKTSIAPRVLNTLRFNKGEYLFKTDARVKDAFHAFAEIDDSKLDQESVEELRWYLLHIKLAANKNDEAFRDSLDYYEKTNDPSISSGYCYWSVKLHLAKGKNYTGTDCVDKYTNYYYGVKTSQLIPRRNLFETCREESLNAVRQVNDDMVLEWYDLLKSEEGKSTADLMFSRNDSKISVYQLNQIAKAYEAQEDFYSVQNLLSVYFDDWWVNPWPEHVQKCGFFYKIAYPRAFSKEVNTYAREYGVPPEVVYAIMREESHFNNVAVSSAGARGLMQLMKPTAKHTASRLRIPYSAERLYNRDYNIKLGTYYIGVQLQGFDGSLTKATAAYNGGPHNVKKWMKNADIYDEDVFVELIPFRETRNYVKKVQRSYYLYNLIYKH